ncbi:MAG TPA: hypothetical protein VFF13_03975 [archaeon]|nr:hypothetical protein [archaeon]
MGIFDGIARFFRPTPADRLQKKRNKIANKQKKIENAYKQLQARGLKVAREKTVLEENEKFLGKYPNYRGRNLEPTKKIEPQRKTKKEFDKEQNERFLNSTPGAKYRGRNLQQQSKQPVVKQEQTVVSQKAKKELQLFQARQKKLDAARQAQNSRQLKPSQQKVVQQPATTQLSSAAREQLIQDLIHERTDNIQGLSREEVASVFRGRAEQAARQRVEREKTKTVVIENENRGKRVQGGSQTLEEPVKAKSLDAVLVDNAGNPIISFGKGIAHTAEARAKEAYRRAGVPLPFTKASDVRFGRIDEEKRPGETRFRQPIRKPRL